MKKRTGKRLKLADCMEIIGNLCGNYEDSVKNRDRNTETEVALPEEEEWETEVRIAHRALCLNDDRAACRFVKKIP